VIGTVRTAMGRWQPGRWLRRDKLFWLTTVILIGLLMGQQIVAPSKRVLEAFAGLVLVAFVLRLDLYWSLCAFLIALPFPTRMKIGSTNIVFIAILLSVWLMRLALRQVRPVGKTFLDTPIIVLLLVYVASFWNIRNSEFLWPALTSFYGVLGSIVLFYLVVNFVRDDTSLERTMIVTQVSAALVIGVSLMGLLFPGITIVPNWIQTGSSQEIDISGIRLGGPFGASELLAEYCALNLPIQFLLLVRSRSLSRRSMWAALILLTFVIQIATVTRGAFIALWIGMAYLLFLMRKQLGFRHIAISVITAIFLFVALATFITARTKAGSILDRLTQTTFVGYMPETRAHAWSDAWEMCKEHPVIGHGPFYPLRTAAGAQVLWPHSIFLYYIYITGWIGLAVFLFIVYKMFRRSLSAASRRLSDPHFSKSALLVLHVVLVIFMIDQVKLEYLRHHSYQFFIWSLFGLLVAATRVAASGGAPVEPKPVEHGRHRSFEGWRGTHPRPEGRAVQGPLRP